LCEEIPALSSDNAGINCTNDTVKLDNDPYPKLKGFKIGHLNITSLPKHIDELRNFMHEVSFDLISINETRLDDSIHNDEVKIPGFDIVRKDRTRNGGVVAIYSRNTIPHTVRDDLIPTDTDIEAICLEINKPKIKPMLLSTWYRPPDSSIELFDKFENFLQKADDENKELIITGDLNCNILATEKKYSHQET
jgi:exonuclease III